MRAAIRLYVEKAHTIAEGAGAASLAAAVKMRDELKGKKVGVVLSGGNLTADMLRGILGSTRLITPRGTIELFSGVGMKLGRVYLEQGQDPSIFKKVVSKLELRPPVVIKPNWGTINNFTEAAVLDGVLGAIPGEKLVVESYGWARTRDALEGKGIGSCKRGDLRASDEWFLEYSGVGKVLEKHGVEFLNVTEEVWNKRVADPAEVRKASERYGEVLFPEMYERVPRRLFDMSGGTLLSLAKYRLNHDPIAFSLSMKNLFGLIPGPGRAQYHGKGDMYLARTIVDMNRIYRGIFDMVGVVDGVYTASRNTRPEDAINPQTAKNKGVLLGSRDW